GVGAVRLQLDGLGTALGDHVDDREGAPEVAVVVSRHLGDDERTVVLTDPVLGDGEAPRRRGGHGADSIRAPGPLRGPVEPRATRRGVRTHDLRRTHPVHRTATDGWYAARVCPERAARGTPPGRGTRPDDCKRRCARVAPDGLD